MMLQIATNAVVGLAAMQGQFFLTGPGGTEANATECIQHLLAHMPRRDLLLLFSEPFRFVDFIIETVRCLCVVTDLLISHSCAFTDFRTPA